MQGLLELHRWLECILKETIDYDFWVSSPPHINNPLSAGSGFLITGARYLLGE